MLVESCDVSFNEPVHLIMVYPVRWALFLALILGLVGIGVNLFRGRHGIMGLLTLGFAMFLVNPIGKSQLHATAGGVLTACKSNLKNLGTAQEMYSTDWSGHYTSDLGQLTPNYLKILPECPGAGKVTYKLQTGPDVPGNETGFNNFYSFECSGRNHAWAAIPQGYPRYDSMGLTER